MFVGWFSFHSFGGGWEFKEDFIRWCDVGQSHMHLALKLFFH